MEYSWGYIIVFYRSVGNLLLARAAARASSWNGFGCARLCAAIASACARVDWMRDGLPRGAVGLRPSAGRGNPVGFRRNCCQCIKCMSSKICEH